MSARGWRKVRSQGSRLCADCQRPLQRLSLISHVCTALVYSSLVINRYIHTDIEKPRKYIVPLSTPKNEISILIHVSRTGSFIHIVFIFNFCGRIADLQCCDSFYWTMIPVYFLVQTEPSLPVLCSCKCFCIPALQNFYSGLEFAFPDCVLLWGRNLISFVIPSVTFIALSSVQSLSRVRLSATPWTAARQASLSITDSWS